MFAVEIIAHRGASVDVPENTLASVRLAWQQNADAAEVDIYLSKDGQIVVLHVEVITTDLPGWLRQQLKE